MKAIKIKDGHTGTRDRVTSRHCCGIFGREPEGLKPSLFHSYGTAEVVPFQDSRALEIFSLGKG